MPSVKHETEVLAGQWVLVVEDEYMIAIDLAFEFEAMGAEVIGPVANVKDALDLILSGQRIDGAVLDINLRGEVVFPVADELLKRGVPFVFTTGYEQAVVPPRYAGAARCEKPVDPQRVANALFQSGRDRAAPAD